MPNNEDWIKEFDEELPYLTDTWGKLKPTAIKQIKSFILKLKSRWVEEERIKIINLLKFKKVLEVSLPSDTERVLLWKQRHNKTLDEVIEFLTTPNKDI